MKLRTENTKIDNQNDMMLNDAVGKQNALVFDAINRASVLIDYNIHNNIEKQYVIERKIILADKSLTNHAKLEAINLLTKYYNYDKILYKEGIRICGDCYKVCFAVLDCEHCI